MNSFSGLNRYHAIIITITPNAIMTFLILLKPPFYALKRHKLVISHAFLLDLLS